MLQFISLFPTIRIHKLFLKEFPESTRYFFVVPQPCLCYQKTKKKRRLSNSSFLSDRCLSDVLWPQIFIPADTVNLHSLLLLFSQQLPDVIINRSNSFIHFIGHAATRLCHIRPATAFTTNNSRNPVYQITCLDLFGKIL